MVLEHLILCLIIVIVKSLRDLQRLFCSDRSSMISNICLSVTSVIKVVLSEHSIFNVLPQLSNVPLISSSLQAIFTSHHLQNVLRAYTKHSRALGAYSESISSRSRSLKHLVLFSSVHWSDHWRVTPGQIIWGGLDTRIPTKISSQLIRKMNIPSHRPRLYDEFNYQIMLSLILINKLGFFKEPGIPDAYTGFEQEMPVTMS